MRPLGTHDFYPNWGKNQPGHGKDKLEIKHSHKAAKKLFIYSIENPGKLITNQRLKEEPRRNKIVKQSVDAAPIEMGYHLAATESNQGMYYVPADLYDGALDEV